MTYRAEIHRAVGEYLRGLEGFTRSGRLAMNGFLDALREYGDEARSECPRRRPNDSVFVLRWTFDAGPSILSIDFHIDDAEHASGLLRVVYAELVALPDVL